MNKMASAITAGALILSTAITAIATNTRGSEWALVEDGQTAHAIVLPESATRVDVYAAEELSLYLGLMTGAEFAVISENALPAGAPAIYIGLSPAAAERLGVDPEDLQPFEYRVQSDGSDIFLYGEGLHGNLNAVFDFLESELGWRWYSQFEAPLLPQQPTVSLTPLNRSTIRSFPYLSVHLSRSMDHPYQMGANMRFDKRVQNIADRHADQSPEDFPFMSVLPESAKLHAHSLHRFIPPAPDAEGADAIDWLQHKNYFETNPDFFSMNQRGERFKHKSHLNFGNPELRAELTRNILEFIRREGDDLMIEIGAMDSVGRLCHSPESVALEDKYQTPGGPMIDYLIELCDVLEQEYPDVRIKMLAYRREQTQKAPVLPEGQMLPDNLIIEFAPVEDNYFGDWTHPDPLLQDTLNDLKQWAAIVPDGNLWAWIYPNPWRTGHTFPVGNVERLVTNMRIMHDLGVSGLFIDHNGLRTRSGFSELQAYLIYKLSQNIDLDEQQHIEEFTDSLYGPAAPLMRQYLTELEDGRKAMETLPQGVRFRSTQRNQTTFPYLTAENIHRWQQYFDEMERQLANQEPRMRKNVALARRELDLAALWQWFELQDHAPDYYTDHTVLAERVLAANNMPPEPNPEWENKAINRTVFPRFGNGLVDDLSIVIRAGGKEKPLPEQFATIDPTTVRTFLPTRQRGAPRFVEDPDAPFGVAVPADGPNMPFTFGIHDSHNDTRLQRHAIEAEAIVPGEYLLFDIGEVEVSPFSWAYFGGSWQTRLNISDELYEPGSGNRWHAYVEVKFEGPSYGGPEPKDQALIGRVIFVNLSGDQFGDSPAE